MAQVAGPAIARRAVTPAARPKRVLVDLVEVPCGVCGAEVVTPSDDPGPHRCVPCWLRAPMAQLSLFDQR
jgi:hypothetical protein